RAFRSLRSSYPACQTLFEMSNKCWERSQTQGRFDPGGWQCPAEPHPVAILRVPHPNGRREHPGDSSSSAGFAAPHHVEPTRTGPSPDEPTIRPPTGAEHTWERSQNPGSDRISFTRKGAENE